MNEAQSATVTVSYLEMTEPPDLDAPNLTILRAAPFPPWYFVALYKAVGEDYCWVDMLELPKETLAQYCAHPQRALHTLIDDGVPAGFFTLFEEEARTNLDYFGLVPQAVGRGWGGKLLDCAIDLAWQRPAMKKLTVDTCTLDHPSALSLYLSRGFVLASKKSRPMSDIERERISNVRRASPATCG